MTESLKFAGQLAVLCVVFWGSDLFVTWTGLPVPANVLGIIILFTLLCCGAIKEEHVAGAANFFLRHLVFFFVPIAVGLMEWGQVFYDYGLVLLIAIVVSSLLPLLGVGFLSRLMHKEKEQ